MGCASSKQKRCWHCRAPYSPVPRSYTMHVHHPAQHKGDSYHVVALTSTTLGNLMVESNHGNNVSRGLRESRDINSRDINLVSERKSSTKLNGSVKEINEKSKGFSMLEAEVWSKLIEDKIPKLVPKTPIRTPPGEPETINIWELMAGLEDFSPRTPRHFRSYSANDNGIIGMVSAKPMCVQFEEENKQSDVVIADFDPEIISSFRKTLERLPPSNPFHLEPSKMETVHCKLNKDKVVLYFTSLRGVRKTYEDCCTVRLILKGLGVRIDERDVSIHSGFKHELKELMGDGFKGGLPRVFVGKRCIGGAEEMKQMHEQGSLWEAIQGCEMVDDDDVGACEACGDIRFVPCETCSGSCKVYYDEDEGEVIGSEGEEGEYGFQRCPDCNENGLVLCPMCHD